MSHTSFLSPKNNDKIFHYVFQFYSNKGLIYQSPIFTNIQTLKLEAFKKIIQYSEDLTMEIVKLV